MDKSELRLLEIWDSRQVPKPPQPGEADYDQLLHGPQMVDWVERRHTEEQAILATELDQLKENMYKCRFYHRVNAARHCKDAADAYMDKWHQLMMSMMPVKDRSHTHVDSSVYESHAHDHRVPVRPRRSYFNTHEQELEYRESLPEWAKGTVFTPKKE
mmetsp:Transcript_24484/g.61392  ORF Transcript_24484/g.61392 Transcript_24484/m.61392 type:complete len:158 (+) Transcript_24484:87-560(+)